MEQLHKIETGLKYPSKIVSELNRIYSHHRFGVRYYPYGLDIFDKDWDNLVVLDACRYDEFMRHVDLPGELTTQTSRGSTTHQFIRGNFSNKHLHDVVYVSANGWFASLRNEINSELHSFIHVDRDAVNGLTSKPETVTETALEAAASYPDKRLIVHYMQPHQPYLGPTGQEFEYEGALYRTKRANKISQADIIRAYRENLQLVLNEVEKLQRTLSGLTVVTADHGELLGEWQRPIPVPYYGHPDGVYVDKLVTVPWLTYQNGERKEIVSEEPEKASSKYDTKDVEQQLESLGYKL